MWKKAYELIDYGIQHLSITSYNEWGEGTQIESAKVSMENNAIKLYLEYPDNNSYFYMNITKKWADQWTKKVDSTIDDGKNHHRTYRRADL